MSLYKQPGSDVWWYSVSVQGRRDRKSTGTSDRKSAQEVHDRRRAELWRASHLGSGKCWTDAVREYLKASRRGRSDGYNIRYPRQKPVIVPVIVSGHYRANALFKPRPRSSVDRASPS